MFFKNKRLIHGIDIGAYSLKFVSVYVKNNKIELKKAVSYKYERSIFNDGVIVRKCIIKKILNDILTKVNIRKGKSSCALGNELVVVRNITLPLMGKKAVEETLLWEYSEHIPFPGDTAVTKYMVRSKNSKEMDITAVIASKNIVNSYYSILKDYKVNILNIQPAALLNIFEYKNISEPVLIIDIGSYSTKIIAGNSSNIFFMRNLKIGASELAGRDKSIAELDEDLYITELNQEVKRAIRFYNRNNRKRAIEKVYLTGGGAYINDIKDKVKGDNNFQVNILKPFSDLKISNEVDVIENKYNSSNLFTEYSVAFGLCLSEMS